MKNKLKLLLLLLLPILGVAQPNSNLIKSAVSPDIGAFESIIENTEAASGVPSVGVSLGSIAQDDLRLNIGLSANMGGVNVGLSASNVGQGWNITGAGGMISVQRNFLKDDESGGWLSVYDDVYDSLTNTPFVEDANLFALWEAGTSVDSEPDHYSYSFTSAGNGESYSGKFLIAPNAARSVMMFPKNDLVVIPQFTGGGQLRGFTIIDPMGIKYTFGNTIGGSENVYETKPNVVPIEITGFYLIRVASPNELHSISLNYVGNSYTFRSQAYERATADACGTITSSCESNTCQINTFIQSKIISSITNSSGTETVTFNSSVLSRSDLQGSPTSIGSIEFSNGPEQKVFDLYYDYFVDNQAAINSLGSKRLKLDSIKESSMDGMIVKPAYKFEYFGPWFNGKQYIVRSDSRRVDHWNFFNNAIGNDAAFINAPSGGYFVGGDRETNPIYAKYGTLKRLTYPTGGYVEYDMESNSAIFSEYQTHETPIYLRSCIPTNASNCCGDIIMSDTITFTSTEQIELTEYELNIALLNEIITECTVPNPSDILVELFNGSTLVGSASIGVTSGTPGTENMVSPLITNFGTGGLDINENIVPGVLYTFKVTTGKGIGEFYLRTKELVNIDRKVGGLRVKQTTIYDGIDHANDIITNYDYSHETIMGVSSGVMKWYPDYHHLTKYWPADFLNIGLYPFSRPNIEIITANPRLPNTSLRSGWISYAKIVKSIVENGRTELRFFTGNLITSYDLELPGVMDEVEGRLQSKKIYDEGNVLISSETYIPAGSGAQQETFPFFMVKRLSAGMQGCVGGLVNQNWPVPITLFTHAKYRLFSKNTLIDGVSATELNYYDPQGRIYSPIANETISSTGEVLRSEMVYPFDKAGSEPAIDSLITKNIKRPIETHKVVDNIRVDGRKTTFKLLNNFPYQDSTYQYKVTWDNNGTLIDNGWGFEHKFDSYDLGVGKPTSLTERDWAPQLFEWYAGTGLLKKRTFLNHTIQFEYSGNGYLSRTIGVDGQYIDQTYDQLGRQDLTLSRPKVGNPNEIPSNYNVVIDKDYHYQDGSDPYNWTQAITTFTPYGSIGLNADSDLEEMKIKEVFDGIGRSIQTIQIDHSPDVKDIVSQTSYDNKGQKTEMTIPVESASGGGTITMVPNGTAHQMLTYENNPTNRLKESTPPEWFPSQQEFGSNEASDNVVGYAVNELRKQSSTDPDGKTKITFADKRGRTVLERVTDGTSTNDTYRMYNSKNQPTVIIPPGSSTAVTDSNRNFYMSYNLDGKLIKEDYPDKGPTHFLYNNKKQQVAMQTSNLKDQNLWLITEQDDYGRASVVGFHKGAINDVENLVIDSVLIESFYDGMTKGGGTNSNPVYKGKLRQEIINVMTATGGVGSTTVSNLLDYDSRGRNNKTTSAHHLGGTDVTFQKFDFADNVVESQVSHNVPGAATTTILWENMLDHQGRLTQTSVKVGSNPAQILSEHHYNHRDFLVQTNIGKLTNVPSRSFLQKVDRSFNAQGWLEMINQPMLDLTGTDACALGTGISTNFTGDDNYDLFSEKINYQTNFGGKAENKNGNISSIISQSRFGYLNYNAFTYDFQDRLLESKSLVNQGSGIADALLDNTSKFTYDPVGNFLTLLRKGNSPVDCDVPITIDSLDYTYYPGSNQIKQVKDLVPCPDSLVLPADIITDMTFAANNKVISDKTTIHEGATVKIIVGTELDVLNDLNILGPDDHEVEVIQGNCVPGTFYSQGFAQMSPDSFYLWDGNGNMIYDPNKDMHISFDFRNLPISFKNEVGEVILSRDAKGTKLRNERFVGSQKVDSTVYVNGMEYDGDTLKLHHAEGIVKKYPNNTLAFYYFIRDHRDDVRFFFNDKNGDGFISFDELEEYRYYPYGMEIQGPWMKPKARNKYLFSGKEHDNFTGVADFDVRFLEKSALGWGQPDPFSSSMPAWSPYSYGYRNPIKYTDKTGLAPESVDGVENEFVRFVDADGNQQVQQISRVGGDEVDIVYDGSLNEDGSVSVNENSSLDLNVNINYTSGPGSGPVPGERNAHGKTHSDLVAYTYLASLYAGGASSSTLSLGVKNRVPKGKAFFDVVKGQVVKGGQFMRDKVSGYLELFKKGEGPIKTPKTNTTTKPTNIDRDMEELLKNSGRFIKDHLDDAGG